MNNYRRYIGLAVGLGLVLAVLWIASAGSALGQGPLRPLEALIINDSTRPVPVRNVEARARVPFSFDDVGDCASNCFFEYPVVPPGKRLVIQHVSGIARPNSPNTIFDQAELVTDNTENDFGARNTFAMTLIGHAGQSVAANTWGFNAPVLAVVEAGHAPGISMITRDLGGAGFSQATIAGYLEDVQ